FAQPNVASQQAVAQPQQGSAEQAGPSSTSAGSAPQVVAASAPTYTQSSSSSSTTSVTTGGITTTTQTNTNNGAVTSNTTTTAAAGTSSTGSAGATSNEQSCAGDFYLGRQAYEDSSQGFGHECNSGRTNCFDGTFLETGDGRCYCVASCPSSFAIGEACSDDGSWTCQHVQATNASANHARICVPDSWNICLQ
ncbi:MAG: hypothetical protein KC561_10105, partial [Myxococcales bacterium]|nr:hypothetical protein [Myxococcales bacterium]